MILGGGITGRLASLLWPEDLVLEQRPKSKAKALTRMWGTNYLWEPIPGLAHRKFLVVTHVDHEPATEARIRKYKAKIGKSGDTNWGLQFEEFSDGYDLLEVPEPKLIMYDSGVESIDLSRKVIYTKTNSIVYNKLISTIPLNILCDLVGLHMGHDNFPCRTIYIHVKPEASPLPSPTDVYVNYISNTAYHWYRWCNREGMTHYETLSNHPECRIILRPGKIMPTEATIPVLRHLAKNDVFCFGRFASWKPNELVHESYKRMVHFKEEALYDF